MKYFRSLFLFLATCSASLAFSQKPVVDDSLVAQSFINTDKKPSIHYAMESNLLISPRFGTLSEINARSFAGIPIKSKLYTELGIIVSHYNSNLINFQNEKINYSSFNSLSVYGMAAYQVNERLTFYGMGTKQLGVFYPLFNFPTGSLTLGSNLKFGNFTFGASLHVTDMNANNLNAPFGGAMNQYPFYTW